MFSKEIVMASFPILSALPQYKSVSYDLHGFRRKEALEAVKSFFTHAKEQNISSTTIITGIGNHRNENGARAVLYNSMPKWLELPEIKAAIKEVRTDLGAYEITLHSEKQDNNLNTMKKVVDAAEKFFFTPQQIAYIRNKAEEGSAPHQYILGGLMLNGVVVEKDHAQGAHLVEQAAKTGDSFAQMQMGFLYELGFGVPKNYDQARIWHLKASKNNAQPYSLFVLGSYYWLGKGVVKDDKKAIEFLSQAADQKVYEASYNLGTIYLWGSNKTKPNGNLAQKYLEQAAQGDVLEAKLLLAKQYFFGWGGIPCDYEKARKWFSETAKANDAVGEYYLGRIYSEGLGVKNSMEDGIVWYRKSAEHGDKDAQLFIAIARLEGNGMVRDVWQGWQKIKSMADEGHPQSQAAVGHYFLSGIESVIKKR